MKTLHRSLPFFLILFVGTLAMAESSFNEVISVLADENPPNVTDSAREELALYNEGELPSYPVNMSSIFAKGSRQLIRDAKRTVSDRSDYYDYLPKLLHSNGVCISGEWETDSSSPFSGALQGGYKGLFIGRISTAMEETTRGHQRGFGFAGKIFPTLDEYQLVPTENFFTVDVLMGTDTQRFLNTAMTNNPEVGFSWSLFYLGVKIASALKEADEDPGFRPIENLAAMNHAESILAPKWIKVQAKAGQIVNNEKDFREEVSKALKENHGLTFEIFWSNTTKDRTAEKGWLKLGEIYANNSFISFGCDRRLHFAHPKIRP